MDVFHVIENGYQHNDDAEYGSVHNEYGYIIMDMDIS